MIDFINKLSMEIAVRENIRVENEIRDWLNLHPNVGFRQYETIEPTMLKDLAKQERHVERTNREIKKENISMRQRKRS